MSLDHHNAPSWFSPLRLLIIFCGVNLFVYLDRGLIASNGVNGSPRTETSPKGSGIQGDFGLTYFQDGLLPAAFMVGLLLTSPFFAEACKHYSAFRLLGMGMGIWSLACLGCGLSPHFVVLLLCRSLVGVGEASFVALAAPFIDDYAPPKDKTKWFAFFYLCIPVGFALGYIMGGLVASSLGWRYAFALEALCMLPFVAFALLAKPVHLHGSPDAGKGSHNPSHPSRSASQIVKEFLQDVAKVAAQRVWTTTCVAYTLYVAVLGVYAYWGPQAGKALFFGPEDTSNQADLVFGAVTVGTGVLGSLAGGILLDRLGSSIRNASLVCSASCGVGFVLVLLAFLTTKSFGSFMAVFALGQLAMFMLQAPVAAIGMWCVPVQLRPLGASLMTVSIHALGDVPSPPLLGWLQTKLSEGKAPEAAAEQWRISMSILSLLLCFACAAFLAGALVAKPESDFRTKEGSSDSISEDGQDTSPLLPELQAESSTQFSGVEEQP